MRYINVFATICFIFYSYTKCLAFKRCSKVDECRCSTDQGVINLWSLRGDSNKPRVNVSGFNASSLSYIWSPCVPWTFTRNTTHQKYNFKGCTNVSVCQIRTILPVGQLDRDIGDQQLMDCIINNETPTPSCMLQYKVSSDPSVTRIALHCDPSKTNPVLDPFGSNYANNIFDSTLHSKCACPGACEDGHLYVTSSLSTGSLLVIIFLCFVFVYLVVGILYNKLVKSATGKELIPHRLFWRNFLYLVKDGCDYSITVCATCGQSFSSKKDYTSI